MNQRICPSLKGLAAASVGTVFRFRRICDPRLALTGQSWPVVRRIAQLYVRCHFISGGLVLERSEETSAAIVDLLQWNSSISVAMAIPYFIPSERNARYLGPTITSRNCRS